MGVTDHLLTGMILQVDSQIWTLCIDSFSNLPFLTVGPWIKHWIITKSPLHSHQNLIVSWPFSLSHLFLSSIINHKSRIIHCIHPSIHPSIHPTSPLHLIKAMVQFSQTTFSDYARLTEAKPLFVLQLPWSRLAGYFLGPNVILRIFEFENPPGSMNLYP